MEEWVTCFDALTLQEQQQGLEQLAQRHPKAFDGFLKTSNSVASFEKSLKKNVKVKRYVTDEGACKEFQQPKTRIDFLGRLSLQQHPGIFIYLDGFSMLACRHVCKRWCEYMSSPAIDHIWEREFCRLFLKSRSDITTSLLTERSAESPVEQNKGTWLQKWKDYLKDRRAWLGLANRDKCNLNKWEFAGHTDRVRHVRIRGNRFVSASWDGTIRLGDTERLSDKTSLVIRHRGSVFGVWFDGKIVASCSEDHTVLLYDIEEQKQVAQLKGHQGPVYRIEFLPLNGEGRRAHASTGTGALKAGQSRSYRNSLLVSCSSDFIGVWDWANELLLQKLTGHRHDVHRLQINNNYIVTGSYDQTIRIWRFDEAKISFDSVWVSPPFHRGGVSAIHLASSTCSADTDVKHYVGSGSAHGDIFIFDINKGMLVFRNNNNKGVENRDTSKNIVTCVYLDLSANLFICCSILSFYSGAGQVCFWDISSGNCLRVLKQSSYINSLKYEFGLLFSAESDGYVRIRDLVKKDAPLVTEEKLSRGQLFDVDIQDQAMVTCGLDRVFLLRPLCI